MVLPLEGGMGLISVEELKSYIYNLPIVFRIPYHYPINIASY